MKVLENPLPSNTLSLYHDRDCTIAAAVLNEYTQYILSKVFRKVFQFVCKFVNAAMVRSYKIV